MQMGGAVHQGGHRVSQKLALWTKVSRNHQTIGRVDVEVGRDGWMMGDLFGQVVTSGAVRTGPGTAKELA